MMSILSFPFFKLNIALILSLKLKLLIIGVPGRCYFSRLEPLSGRISSVTQVLPEGRQPATALTTSDYSCIGSSRMDVTPGDRPGEEKEGGGEGGGEEERGGGGRGVGEGGGGVMEHGKDMSGSGKEGVAGVIPGGVFAGVGEFLPTQKHHSSEEGQPPQLRDLDMKYAEEAMLR